VTQTIQIAPRLGPPSWAFLRTGMVLAPLAAGARGFAPNLSAWNLAHITLVNISYCIFRSNDHFTARGQSEARERPWGRLEFFQYLD